MSDFLFLIIVGLILFAAIGAVILAIALIGKNRKKQKATPEIRTTAKVARLNEQQNSSLSVDSANARTDSVYYVDFVLADKSKVTFKVGKKQFLSLNKGDSGTLTYKGNKLIDFDKSVVAAPVQKQTFQTAKYFFSNAQKSGLLVKFYADAPGLDISIPSDAQIDCDFAEVSKFLNRWFGSGADSFFGLEKSTGEIIQLSNDGKSQTTEIDIPQPGGYSYKGMIYSAGEALDCVKDFFNGADLIGRYKLTLEKW